MYSISKYRPKGGAIMSILCIGVSVYDMTLPIDEPFVENTKMRIKGKYEAMGGQATCAACTSAKWGMDTKLISRVGNDTFGNKIMQDLQDLHVDTSYMKMLDGYETALSVIINHTYNGNRTILNQQDTLEELTFTYPEEVEVILLDGHELKASKEALAKYPNAKVIVDAERCSDITMALLPHADYIVCSEDFAQAYTGLDPKNKDHHAEMFAQVKALNKKEVVITLGAQGLLYESNGVLTQLPAFKVDVVDTTGAGDIFHGAFAYGVAKGMPIEKIVRMSSMASALSIQKQGCVTSIPTLEEVEKGLE